MPLHRSVLALGLIGLAAMMAPYSAEAKVGKSLLVGGIRPCNGLPVGVVKNLRLPRYVAGIVYVLEGRITRNSHRAAILPTHIVTKQTVRANGTFRFILPPGPYVLSARLPHATAQPFLQIDVREGVTVHADIPNTVCK